MVDGGVRNVSPIGDVLSLEPDEIIIINCTAREVEKLPKAPGNISKIAQRTIDLLVDEIFVGDLQEFLRINALVKQAEERGFKLYHPVTGHPLKYYPCHVIEPDVPMGDVLDFSQKSVQYRMEVGRRRAMEVLG
jgi:NTE family protein